MFSSFFGVMGSMREVPVRDVCMMSSLHMVAGFVMLRGFAVVFGRVIMMLGCFMMMRSARMICHSVWFSFVTLIILQSRSVIK
jgi:hypothetical protein